MAQAQKQIVSFDRESIDALKRLARALEHANELRIEEGRNEQTKAAVAWAAHQQLVLETPVEEIKEQVRKLFPAARLRDVFPE